jgi:starch-binding outer membrane protein, SusD/RagB family
MKHNLFILFILGLLITFGCEKIQFGNEFLEKAPGVDITKDTIFSNIVYAERFLWGAYKTLPYGLNVVNPGSVPSSLKYDRMNGDLLESMTDICQSYLGWGGVVPYYNGSYNASTEDWSSGTKYHLTKEQSFDGIRQSYIFIQNIDRVPNVDVAYKNTLKAEARMIIAVHYTDMYRHYGGMPWINHAYTTNEEISSFLRLTARATCDSIVALIDKAAANLPWVVTDPDAWDGRFTKAGALGLKARLLLFDASPLFNSSAAYLEGTASQQKLTWHGSYDANLWKKAADAAQALINQVESSGNYKLYHKDGNTLRKDYQDAYYLRGNGEVLISTRYNFRTTTYGQTDYMVYSTAGAWGAGNVTNDYVEMFPMANGLPITNPASGYDPLKPYLNRDPRLYETVVVNGDSYKGRTAEIYLGGQERPSAGDARAITGYFMKKFQLDRNTATSYGSIVHWPYLRLPEIYLSYAEASNEYTNGPSAEAYRCVNIVRKRVGLGDLPAGLTKEQFREAVLTERALEFGWEEVRWFDLIRWKREGDFKKTLHGVNIVRSGSSPNYTFTYTKFDILKRFWMDTWSPKWYLSAFPTNEINKGYGLVQNPGWE